MNRRTRTIAVVTIALLFATLASVGVYTAIQRIPVREVEVANYHVVVAAKSLPMGTRLSPADLKTVAWPSSNPIVNGFSDPQAIVDRGLLTSIAENEPVTETKLAAREAGAGLPPSIPPGMRAMSVKVNEVVGVAGFVVAGTRVDLLVTLRRDNNAAMTRTVASNIQVLTAGTQYDRDKSRDGEAIPSTVVTLMVTPDDAERITLAQTQGQIMLALRNPLDLEPTDTNGIATGALMGDPAPPPVVKMVRGTPRVVTPKPEAAPAPTIYTVEAIRAAKRTEEVVQKPGEVIR
jgi:pilus assembly protein CpaB